MLKGQEWLTDHRLEELWSDHWAAGKPSGSC